MKFMIAMLLAAPIFASENRSNLNTVFGDNTIAPIENDDKKSIPGDQVVPPIDGSKIDEIISEAQKAWAAEQEKVANPGVAQPAPESVPVQEPEVAPESLPRELPRRTKIMPASYSAPQVVRYEKKGDSITVFPTHLNTQEEETITLPSGAHAFGRVKFGEEVTASADAEVVVELDYAFLGPNESVVEMNGCIAWLKVVSNFHSQKIKGSIQDITCTMPSGRVFTIAMDGPIVGAASGYAGVESDLIMKGPAKAAALKFLGEITSAYGAATSAVETTTDMLASERSTTKATNITGDKKSYATGKVIEAHGEFLKYISSFFSSMQPTLALAPGTKIHVVNRYNIKIPKVFFKMKGKNL